MSANAVIVTRVTKAFELTCACNLGESELTKTRWLNDKSLLAAIASLVIASTTQAQDDTAKLPGVVASAAELATMKRYLSERDDPRILRTRVKGSDDDEWDCIEKRYQHGFDRPIDSFSTPPEEPIGGSPAGVNVLALAQTTYEELPTRCPEGTIPRHRITFEELSRFHTLKEYFAKGSEPPATQGPIGGHQYAVLRNDSVNHNGVQAVLSIWQPYVELDSEFSVQQLWAVGGWTNPPTAKMQTVEAGIQIFPNKYGDRRPHLFIFFTPDNYTNGCYNQECTGFVQTDNRIPLGAAFSTVSTPGGPVYESPFQIQQNPGGDWWIKVNNIWVGFYPASIFATTGLRDGGNKIEFGGEIVDKRTGGRHTQTDMGSGALPTAGAGIAAYQRGLSYFVGRNPAGLANATGVIGTGNGSPTPGWNCYDAYVYNMGSPDTTIVFGGPGYDPTWCY
jgi:hypothetical protein